MGCQASIRDMELRMWSDEDNNEKSRNESDRRRRESCHGLVKTQTTISNDRQFNSDHGQPEHATGKQMNRAEHNRE